MAQTLFDLLADPEAAAFLPPFAKDLRKKPKNIDVLNAGIAGIGDLAYDVAGFPVDMSTALMRALGAQTGQTPFGSDWLKQRATNAGIRPPESADPTLRDVRLGAEMMAGGIDPFATARGIGVVGSKVAKELEPTLFNALDTYAQKAGLQPSILPQEAAKKVMGQTKIVDESGAPKLLYRGSRMEKGAPLDWNEARQSETGKGQDTGQWFSDNPSVGTSYAGSRRQQGYVAPAYLDMRNPLVVDAGGNTWGQIPREGLGELASRIPKETLTTDEIARIAKAQGYDGVEFRNIIDRGPEGAYVSDPSALERPSTVYVTFNPKAARSALSDKAIAGAARVPPRPKAPVQQAVQVPTIEAPVSPAGFYSATEQAALNLTKTKGTGQSLLDELMKAPNVKKDEMEAIGLLDAFQNKKQVTKQELIDYIGKNKVELGSTVRGDYEVPKVNMHRLGAGDIGEIFKSPNGHTADGAWNFGFTSPDTNETRFYNAYRIPSSNGVGGVRIPERVELYDSNRNLVDEFMTVQDAQRYVENDAVAAARNDYGPTRPKFQDYAYEGGQNYQETLLTLPTGKEPVKVEKVEGKNLWRAGDQTYLSEADARKAAAVDNRRSGYQSSHWEQPNVMAHVRTQDFVDADGKKMRLIEEVQSDWHQAGREKGYATSDNAQKKYDDYLNNLEKRVEEEIKQKMMQNGMAEEQAIDFSKTITYNMANDPRKLASYLGDDESQKLMSLHEARMAERNAVPDAPMKDTWYQTALRKAVKDAIDAGQDRVGITTGATQADRYDLSQQISEVNYSGSNFVAYDKNGATVIEKTGVTENDLPDLIGKEAAKKLLEQPKQGTLRSLSGIDLQVGGEGMKTYYDEIYPKYLDKFAKKYGSSVKEGAINIGEESKLVQKLRSNGYDPETVTLQEILSDHNGIMPPWIGVEDGLLLERGANLTSKKIKKEPVRYIEITPEMRKAFGGKDKGVPLFQMAPAIPAGAIGAGGLLDQFGERQQ